MNIVLTTLALITSVSTICTAATSPATSPTRKPADAGKTCYPQQGMNCLEMPGLREGQRMTLNSDVTLDATNQWVFFTDGNQIPRQQLTKNLGQSYCAITAADKTKAARTHKITGGTYELSEISWYVNTVFFTREHDAFVLYCSVVDEQFSNPGVTSAAAIQKNLKGILN